MTATFKDPDPGVSELKWQWYRSDDTGTNRARCADYDPHADPTTVAEDVRYFIDTAAATIAGDWIAIPGATSATYTPGYDEDSGGTPSVNDGGDEVTWTGGDIQVVITTAELTETNPMPGQIPSACGPR